MKLHLTALIAIFSLACTNEDSDVTWWQNEKRIIELEGQLDLANFKASQLEPTTPLPSGPTSVADPAPLRSEIAALQTQKQKLSLGIAEMRANWKTFQSDVLSQRRHAVLGKSFEVFETSQGLSYRDAIISNIDNTGVSIRHSSGSTRLRCEDLNAEEQAFFGLDRDLSIAALRTEQVNRIAYEKWVNKNVAIAEKKEAKLAEEREREEKKRAQARALAISTSKPTPLSSSIGALGETSRVYGSYGRYSSSSRYSSYRRPRSRYVYYYNNTPSSYRPQRPTFSISRPAVSPVIIPPGCPTTNPFAP